MHVYHFALTSTSKKVSFSDLSKVAAAISKQTTEHVSNYWNRQAIVSAFPDEQSVPLGAYKVTVQDTLDQPGALGYHTDENGQPYALVDGSENGWSMRVSHEILETLIDPWGSRLYPGVINSRRVLVLQELCDPCEAFSYEIDGVAVSDFLTPFYYDATIIHGRHYSYLNKLSAPFDVADGGYLSYLDGNEWYQITNFGELQTTNLGPATSLMSGYKSVREAIDAHSAANHKKLGKIKIEGRQSFVGPF